jgi:type II secretion system protein G
MKKFTRGFTLIELLVVIAIIGILSSVVLASLNSARQKSRDARRISDLSQVKLALELYFDAHNAYPTTAQGTAILVTENFLGTAPTAPLAGEVYTYEHIDGTNYVLMADLEDPNNSVLDTDVDGTIVTVAAGGGASSVNCGATPEVAGAEYYCIQP